MSDSGASVLRFTPLAFLYDIARWLHVLDEIVEARVLSTEGETHGASRTVALFTNNDLRHPFILRVCFVDLVTIDEHDDVCILLDRTAFANIGHHRSPVGALLDLAVELRQGDHRNVEFFRQ